MKKWLLFLPLFLFHPASSEQFPLTDFHCGLNSNDSSVSLRDCEVQAALNVLFDEKKAAVKRQGIAVSASTDAKKFFGGWAYTDTSGNAWRVYLASNSIVATKGDNVFSIKIATVTAESTVNAVTAFNKIWFVDQQQGVYNWDGSATTYIASSPQGKYIAQYKNRLAVIGLASPNQSYLYLSKYLDGTTWATGTLSTDPAIFPIGLNDSSDIPTALYSGFNDVLLIFKHGSIWGLFGTDNTDFQARTLNTEVGCIDQRSIQPYKNGLVFVSARAVEYYNGATVIPISDKIKNYIDLVVNTAFNFASIGYTSQTDFDLGTSTPVGNLSTSLSPGNLVTNFSSSTITISTSIPYCSVSNCTTPTNSGFETGDLTGWDAVEGGAGTWSAVASDAICTTITNKNGTYVAKFAANAAVSSKKIQVIDLGNNVLVEYSPSGLFCSMVSNDTCYSDSFRNKRVKFRIEIINANGTATLTTSSSYLWGSYRSGLSKACLPISEAGDLANSTYWEMLLSDVNPVSSATYTSASIDTGIIGPHYSYLNATATIDSSTPTYSIQTSADNVTFSEVATSTNTSFVSQRYLKFVSTITSESTYDGRTSLDSMVVFTRSSGTFYSQVFNNSTLSRWENFNATSGANDGTNVFSVRASSEYFTVLSATPSWTEITPNTIITISTGAYFQMSNAIGITKATHTPTTSDFSFNFYTGQQVPPMASAAYKQRYYLSTSSDTTTGYNNVVFVLGRNFSEEPIWSIWDLKAGAFVVQNGKLYHGSADVLGKEYQNFVGYSDAGTAINAYITTKDYGLNDITVDKYFDSLHLYAENKGTFDLATTYYVNKISTGFDLSTALQDESTGILNLRLPFSTGNLRFGKTIAFKFSNAVDNQQMELLGGILYYTPGKQIK